MEIIIPKAVEAAPPEVLWSDQSDILRFIFRGQDDLARAGRSPCLFPDGCQNVFLRLIENGLGRVKPEAVEMKFLDPVAGVAEKEYPHWTGVCAIEVDGVAPVVFMPIGEVVLGKRAQVISIWSEVI